MPKASLDKQRSKTFYFCSNFYPHQWVCSLHPHLSRYVTVTDFWALFGLLLPLFAHDCPPIVSFLWQRKTIIPRCRLCILQRKKADHVLSADAVSFHYVSPGQMYMFDFLLYGLNRHWTTLAAAAAAAGRSTHSTFNSTTGTTRWPIRRRMPSAIKLLGDWYTNQNLW